MASRIGCYFCSSIGQKKIMALGGLVWCGFVFTHMLGNILIFVGPEAYNKYSHALVSNPAIYLAEAFLVITLLMHVVNGIKVTIQNKKARKQNYVRGTNGEKGVSLASKTMAFHGIVILVFLVFHIVTLKYGTYYSTTYDGVEMRDLFKLMVEMFESHLYSGFYFAVMVLLGFHLSHGFYSAFQTLGFYHDNYTPKLKCLSVLFGVVVSAGFLAQAIYLHLIYQG